MTSSGYKPTQLIKYKRREELMTDEEIYWRRLKTAAVIAEPGHVGCIDFSPISPHFLAASCSVKLTLYDTSICEPFGIYSRFKRAVYSGRFRHDGSLLATGGEEGKVRIFDVASGPKAPLRQYKAHEGALHSVRFTASGYQLMSFGDDRSIKCWNVAESSSKPVVCLNQAHTDHIRCSDVSRTANHLIVSGSYDHTAKFWDTRCTERDSSAVLTVNHGAPIEDVVLFPNDSLLATAGGTIIRIWDMTAGGRQIAELSHHHKTITCLSLATNNTRLLSGGLDRRIKIYDISNYRVIHTIEMPASVLSVAISPDDTILAAGMTGDNLLSIQRRTPDKRQLATAKRPKSDIVLQQVAPLSVDDQSSSFNMITTKVESVGGKERSMLARFDQMLKTFRHSKALDVLLKSSYFMERRPNVIVSALRELQRRHVLAQALAGRDYSTLAPLLRFICRFIGRQPFFNVLNSTTHSLVEIYGNDVMLELPTVKLLKKLRGSVGRELAAQKQLCSVVGCLDLLFASAHVHERQQQHSTVDEIFGEPIIEPIPMSNTTVYSTLFTNGFEKEDEEQK